MVQDWETEVQYPQKLEKICNILDNLAIKYEIHTRNRLDYLIIKQQTRENMEKIFHVEG